ncbi:DUF2550 family protein [Nocardia tengchongensis]|uniref:DUF2550 family protein n=1 Tax=Nocardia tengchongensis TaxID=2055889 RepID=A0ABX8CNR8_9NOCA|nr:DUF2550 family protein [Nocardia tengchongensis]
MRRSRTGAWAAAPRRTAPPDPSDWRPCACGPSGTSLLVYEYTSTSNGPQAVLRRRNGLAADRKWPGRREGRPRDAVPTG